MFASRFLAQVAVSLVLVLGANAETHVIKFVNQCGYGTPALMQNGVNILTSDTYTSNGPWSGIAYLQTGYCNVNGENCTLLETTLINPTCAGCGSSTDLSLIPPHSFNVVSSFAYYNGCDGQGRICSNQNCVGDAFFGPNDNYVQVACQNNDVNLLFAFCADARQLVSGTVPASTTGSSSSPPSSLSTSSGSLPTNTLPMPSGTPSLGPSTTGAALPVVSSNSATPSAPPTPSQASTNVSDLRCGQTGSASIPTVLPSHSAVSAPASKPASSPISTPTTTPTIPANSAPPPASATSASAPVSVSASPTTDQSCQPQTSGLSPSGSAPMSSAKAPSSPAEDPTTTPVPISTPTSSTNPSITPVTSAGAASGTSDPCGDPTGGRNSPSTSTPSAQRRHHRRTNRIRY